MNDSPFELIVIGTGPASSTVAEAAAEDGKRVAVIEAREVGGTCALRGCNPKKVYTNAGNLIDRVRGANGQLLECDEVRINWQQLLAFKREFTKPVAEDKMHSFQERGITTYQGTASFVGPNEVQVREQRLAADKLFIGVGSHPRPLDIPGGEHAIHSDAFLELSQIPKRVVFVGGGYISMEFACVVGRYGAQVTVLQRGEQVLKAFDPDLVGQLVDYSRQQGLAIQDRSEVKSIEPAEDGAFTVKFQRSGKTLSVEADLVVHGAGRVPKLDVLNLRFFREFSGSLQASFRVCRSRTALAVGSWRSYEIPGQPI